MGGFHVKKEFWEKFGEVVEGVVRRARAEELKDIAEIGFEKVFKIFQEYSKILEELSKCVALVWFGVEDVDKIKQFVYTDTEGRYMGRGDTIE